MTRHLFSFSLLFVISITTVAATQIRVQAETRADIEIPTPVQISSSRAATGFFQSAVHLSGYIRDPEGSPVDRVDLMVIGSSGKTLGTSRTDKNGYYELVVPRDSLYRLETRRWGRNDVYQVHQYAPAIKLIKPTDASEARADIVMRPGGNIVLRGFDAKGNLIRTGAFRTITNNYILVTDLDDQPNYGRFVPIFDTLPGQSQSLEMSIPAVAVPLHSSTRIYVQWLVPEFGQVFLTLDNEGQGYKISEQGGLVYLNVSYEAAKSELTRLRREYAAIASLGYSIDNKIADAIQNSEFHLRKAEAILNQGPQEQLLADNELNFSLRDTLLAQEELHLQRAQADIEKNRKGTITLRIVASDGRPLPKRTVNFRQTSHDFLFGVFPMGKRGQYDPRYAELLQNAGFNYSTIHFHWRGLEPQPGRFTWSVVDQWQNIKEQMNHGFQIMGIALRLARGADLDDTFCPLWMDSMSFADLKTNAYEHLRAVAARYSNNVETWIIAEQNTSTANCLNFTWEQKIEYIHSAIAGLRAGDPTARIAYNAFPLTYNGAEKLDDTNAIAIGASYIEFLNLLRSRGTRIDAIALEFYYAGNLVLGSPTPGMTLASESRWLDQYAQFGKPIYVKEVCPPSVMYSGSSWWHRPWDEATQAEFIEKFYTIAFSKPLVKEIGYGAGISDENAFVRSCGILDENLKPKPAYFTLKKLIASWTTSGVGTTDDNGELVIKGFAGDYQIDVMDQASISFLAHITEKTDSSSVLTLPASSVLPPQTTSAPVESQASRQDQTTSAPVDSRTSQQDLTWISIVFVVVIAIGGFLSGLKIVCRRR